MDKIGDILNAVRRLSRDERRRLIVELKALDSQESTPAERGEGPYAALRALSGTVQSDFADISTDKYPHVAASADPER